MCSTTKSVQTAQHSFLPPVPEESINSNQSLGHISTATNAINEVPKARIEAICEIQTVEPATVRSYTKQVGTQITSIDDPSTDITYERDHSFIIIPSTMKQKARRSHRRSGTPKICFPEPPPSPSTSSTSSTSGSSIYYIKKHKSRKHQIHAKRSTNQAIAFDQDEYATVTKKTDDGEQKKSSLTKSRQKYLKSANLNRVGAFDGITQPNSSQSSIDIQLDAVGQRKSDENDGFDKRNVHLYEHIEAFNPLAAFKPKMLSQYTLTDKTDGNRKLLDDVDEEPQSIDIDSRHCALMSGKRKTGTGQNLLDISNAKMFVDKVLSHDIKSVDQMTGELKATEKIEESIQARLGSDQNENTKAAINANDRNEVDNLSVGSFLSMASVKSFPKCQVPDPLNTVLQLDEKITQNNYDEIEATQAATNASRVPRIVDQTFKIPPKPSSYSANNNETAKSNANREFNYFNRSRSDATDPGVIGPIAFNFHKKRMDKRGIIALLQFITSGCKALRWI